MVLRKSGGVGSTVAKARGRRDSTRDEVQPKGIWWGGRVVTIVLTMLLLAGLPLLFAEAPRASSGSAPNARAAEPAMTAAGFAGLGRADMTIGIGALCLAVGAGLVALTRRGSGGRHRS